MKKTLKSIISVTLCILMITSFCSLGAFAEDQEGSCGDGVVYSYSNGVLTLSYTGSGTGMMDDYIAYTDAPWYTYRKSITSVVIGDGITSIGDRAIFEYSSLTNINIPDSITRIGEEAFWCCTNLKSIVIPNSVTGIGEAAFGACSNLVSIIVEEDNPTFDSRNNCNAIIETATNTLIVGCEDTVIPDSVTSIGESAFDGCTSLTSITIPDSITNIGGYAFYGCMGLTSITIPNKVTSIGYRAFYGCNHLTSITIPNSVTSIGGYAFYGCSGLTSISITKGVTGIEKYAFAECKKLTSIRIPSSVVSIEPTAFYKDNIAVYCCPGSYASNVEYSTGLVTLYTEHNWQWVYNDNATTEADGTETLTCLDCGATDGERIKEGTKIIVPNKDANVKVAAATTIDYRSKVTIIATAAGIDEGYHLEMVANGQTYKGNRTEVKADLGELKNDVAYQVKVVKDNGEVQNNFTKDGGKITVNAGFFKKLIAFFKGLFGSLPSLTVKPN